jgi:hypothetical protein
VDRFEEFPLPDSVIALDSSELAPVLLPRLGDIGPIYGDILSSDSHPYDSGLWTSIGSWAWWENAAPIGDQRIRCTPFSKEQRQNPDRKDADFEGKQLLRFDGARYSRFKALLRVKLRAPPDEENRDPFACLSHSGSLGLAFHMQDDPVPGCTWGGGYIASVTLDPRIDVSPSGGVGRIPGLALGLKADDFSVNNCLESETLSSLGVPVARDELLSPDGFLLTFRVDGPNIQVSLNDRVIMSATDSSPDAFHSGRIALFASRIIATFESLEIVPLDLE